MPAIKLIIMFFVATSFLKAIKETQQKNMALAYSNGFSEGTKRSNVNIKTRRKQSGTPWLKPGACE